MSEMIPPPGSHDDVHQPSGTAAPDTATAFDQPTGSVAPVRPVNAILGVSNFSYDFFNEGGTNNLKPGRPTTQTSRLAPPAGTTGGYICLHKVTGMFVTDRGTHLTERPLGLFSVAVEFGANNTLVCTVQLSDSNSDDPVKVYVHGTIVYFR